VVNVDKSETIGNTEEKPSIVTNQPSNQSFSSPLREKTYVSSTSEVIPTNKCFVAKSTDLHGPLVQITAPLLETTTLMPTATTFVASQPPMQNNKLVKGPKGQMIVEINVTNSQAELTPIEPEAVSFIKVFKNASISIQFYTNTYNTYFYNIILDCE